MLKSLFFILALLLTGCATKEPIPEPVTEIRNDAQEKAEAGAKAAQTMAAQELSGGIEAFANGKYGDAINNLNNALATGLLNIGDQIKAHKFLAFTYCVSNRRPLCREAFGKALDINPELNLEPTEAGHPLWGPVFKSVKAERTKKTSPAVKNTRKARDNPPSKAAKTAGSKDQP